MNYYNNAVTDFETKDGKRSIINGHLGPFNFVIGKNDINCPTCYVEIPFYMASKLFGYGDIKPLKEKEIIDTFNDILRDNLEITLCKSVIEFASIEEVDTQYRVWIGWEYDDMYIHVEEYISDTISIIEDLMAVDL